MSEIESSPPSGSSLSDAVARAERAHACESGWFVLFPPLDEGTLWIAPRPPMIAGDEGDKKETPRANADSLVRVLRCVEHACFVAVITEAVVRVADAPLEATTVVVADGGVRWMPAPLELV